MQNQNRTVMTACVIATLAGTQANAQFAQPTPQSTQFDGTPFVDPFTGLQADFLPPTTGLAWPGNTVAAANYFFNGYVDDDGDGVVDLGDPIVPTASFTIIDSSQGGPLAFSATRHDRGDIDPTFGLARPNDPLSFLNAPIYSDTNINGLAIMLNGQSIEDVSNSGQIRTLGGQFSSNTGGLPTYAWKPDVAQGVTMVQSISNGVAPPQAPSPSIDVTDIIVNPTGDLQADYQGLVSGTSGLRNYWTFEDTAVAGELSTVEDIAGTDDGTVKGTVNSIAGLVGNTGSFLGDDTDDFNNVVQLVGSGSDTGFDLQGSFTIEALIRTDAFPTRFSTVISRGDNSWRMSSDTNEGVGAFEPSANGLAGSTTNDFVNTENGEWHYVAIVVDSAAGTQTSWVNNVPVTENFTPGSNVDLSTFDVLIGGNSDLGDGSRDGREFQGEIDEVAIYNRALTETEILQRVKLAGTDVDLSPPPVITSYLIPNAVANSADRTGVGYSMINGLWGDANGDAKPNAIRLQLSSFGDTGEVAMPFAMAWFPYELGFIGGYHTPKGLEYRHPPIFNTNTAEPTGPTTDPQDIADFFLLPPTEQIAGKTVNWRIATASGITSVTGLTQDNYPAELGLPDNGITGDYALYFEGNVTIDTAGQYFFGIEVDDSGLIDVLIDGEWVTVAGRRNTGGCTLFEGGVTLEEGTYPVRVRYVQRGGGGCLTLRLDTEFTFGETLVFDEPGATVAQYDLDLFDARSSRYIGLVDEDNDDIIDYGLGTWRIEDITRASVNKSLYKTPQAVKYLPDPNGGNDNGLHGRIRFDLPGITPDMGMLFVQAGESSGANAWVGLLPSEENDTHWEAHVRRNNDGDQVEIVDGAVVRKNDADSIASIGSSHTGFLFIPWNARNLVGAQILADGTIDKSEGALTVNKTGTGTFEVTIPGKTGADGMLLTQPVGVSTLDANFATRATVSYEYDDTKGVFVVQAREWIPGDNAGSYDSDLNEYALVDTGFNFIWVDFVNPLRPCNVDINTDGFEDFFDLDAILAAAVAGVAPADRNSTFTINGDDIDLFVEELLEGCQ